MSYSLKDLAKDTVKGNVEFAGQDLHKRRIDVCNVCDYNKVRTCTKCGCFIDIKTKLVKSTCPMGKW